MKFVKRITALFLAMVMVMALGITASAATIKTGTGVSANHTYQVYQIFTGTVNANGEMESPKWGAQAKNNTAAVTTGGTVPTSVLDELAGVKDKTTSEKLAVIEKYADLTKTPYDTVTSTKSLSNVPAGYYLIKDTDKSLSDKDEAYTIYVVQILSSDEEYTINPKSDKPTVDKQVLDETGDAETGATNGWGETADHDINEVFQFKLIAKIPDSTNIAEYKHYRLTFEDTMSTGVTYNGNIKVNVYQGTSTTALATIAASEYSTSGATVGTAGQSWSLTVTDLMANTEVAKLGKVNGLRVEVVYDAYLNENAVVMNDDDNQNTVSLKYSNNPKWNGSDTPDEGKTGPDTVFVFTYKLDNKKVDASDKTTPLGGATFELRKDSLTGDVVKLYEKDGTYYPIGSLTGKTEATLTSAASTGVFNIKGLDVGTYYIVEKTAPEGYTVADPVKITITATHEENADTTSANATITINQGESTTNVNGATVEDYKKSALPETGGMGTTVLYVAGIAMIIVAGIVVIARKRNA